MHGEAKHLALIRAQTGVAGVKLASEHNIRTNCKCVCSTPQSGSHIAGLVVLVGAVQGAPCKGGAGRRASRKERSGRSCTDIGGARAVCVLCCSGAGRGSHTATSRGAGGQTVGFCRTTWHILRGAVHEERGREPGRLGDGSWI